MRPNVVQVTHHFSTPAERVFDAWLTPQIASRFLFATRTGNILRCEIDAKVGGSFFVTDRRPTAEGDESVMDQEHRGTFLELDRPRLIAFEFGVPPYVEPPTQVAVDIKAQGPQACEVILTHDLGEATLDRETVLRTQRGWITMLALLERELQLRRIGVQQP
jgi:uncharacterized protein YndB with AHSA1/START domain